MKNTELEELIIKEKREYFKKWRDANKEKVKKNNANYWKKRAENKLKERIENANKND